MRICPKYKQYWTLVRSILMCFTLVASFLWAGAKDISAAIAPITLAIDKASTEHPNKQPETNDRGFNKDALKLMEKLPEACHYNMYCALRALGIQPSQVMLKLVLTPMGDAKKDLQAVQLFNDWVQGEIKRVT